MSNSNNKQARIISDIPGRLRTRLPKHELPENALKDIADHLGTREGITHIDTNNTTGSVTISYDTSQTREQVISILKDVGVIAYKTASEFGEKLPKAPTNNTSMSIISALDDIDRRLSKITGANIDLKLLFPLTLGVAGIRQLCLYGLGLPQIPAYILLWYAFDSFWKFNSKGAGQQL